MLGHHLERVREEVRGLIRAQGLRATAARIDVLVVLHEAAGPLNHEQVITALRGGVYDKASIWRILSDLADAGILRRMDLGDRIWRYELLDACRVLVDDHPHFLCEACGDVRCLPPLEVRAKDGSLPIQLHQAEFHVRVVGRCGDCIRDQAGAAERPTMS